MCRFNYLGLSFNTEIFDDIFYNEHKDQSSDWDFGKQRLNFDENVHFFKKMERLSD